MPTGSGARVGGRGAGWWFGWLAVRAPRSPGVARSFAPGPGNGDGQPGCPPSSAGGVRSEVQGDDRVSGMVVRWCRGTSKPERVRVVGRPAATCLWCGWWMIACSLTTPLASRRSVHRVTPGPMSRPLEVTSREGCAIVVGGLCCVAMTLESLARLRHITSTLNSQWRDTGLKVAAVELPLLLTLPSVQVSEPAKIPSRRSGNDPVWRRTPSYERSHHRMKKLLVGAAVFAAMTGSAISAQAQSSSNITYGVSGGPDVAGGQHRRHPGHGLQRQWSRDVQAELDAVQPAWRRGAVEPRPASRSRRSVAGRA